MVRYLFLGLLFALGCERASPEPNEPTELRIKDTQLFGEPAPELDEIEIELLDPGREPRHALRYRPEPGSEQTVTLEHTTDMDWFANDQRVMTRQAPPARNRFTIRVLEVTEAGDIRCQLEILESQHVDFTKMGSSGGQGVLISLNELVGYTFDTTISALGHARIKDFMLRDDVPGEIFFHAMQIVPMLADTLTVPLPDEAVGAGASWRVTKKSSLNGVNSIGIFTYRLEPIELDERGEPAGIRVRAKITSRADPQLMVDDVVMVVESFEAAGSEDMDISLSALARSRWQHSSDTTMAMTMRISHQRPAVKMKLSMKLSSMDK